MKLRWSKGGCEAVARAAQSDTQFAFADCFPLSLSPPPSLSLSLSLSTSLSLSLRLPFRATMRTKSWRKLTATLRQRCRSHTTGKNCHRLQRLRRRRCEMLNACNVTWVCPCVARMPAIRKQTRRGRLRKVGEKYRGAQWQSRALCPGAPRKISALTCTLLLSSPPSNGTAMANSWHASRRRFTARVFHMFMVSTAQCASRVQCSHVCPRLRLRLRLSVCILTCNPFRHNAMPCNRVSWV